MSFNNFSKNDESFSKLNYDNSEQKSTKNYLENGKNEFTFNNQETSEALPKIDFYRETINKRRHDEKRPTLEELHNYIAVENKCINKTLSLYSIISNTGESGKKWQSFLGDTSYKMGWIQGVFVRCLLNIWGIMLFLRLSWCVGHAGLIIMLLIILLSTLITLLTTVSMSAICTNGEIKSGGTYFIISRSLGPQFGGSVGIVFSLANAVAVAMNLIGFAETCLAIAEEYDFLLPFSQLNCVRLIGCLMLSILFVFTKVDSSWENYTQNSLLILLLLALVDVIIGVFRKPSSIDMTQAFVGTNWSILQENSYPNWNNQSFISLFGIFFPSSTGILAGASMSGDLKDPSAAIPKGTFWAIGVTSVSYAFLSFLCALCVQRDNPSGFGLLNSNRVMQLLAWYGPLVYAGMFATTFSSALDGLTGAPKVFNALCQDQLFPCLSIFAGHKSKERRIYLLTMLIVFCCILIANLNEIAPLITNFYLASYCMLNFACFHASSVKLVGFRPSYRFYSRWASLAGALICLAVMFVLNWLTALLTFALTLSLYTYLYYQPPDVNWGSSTQAQTYMEALHALERMMHVPDHVKTFRPQILLLSGLPSSRPALLDLAYAITKQSSLIIAAHVLDRGCGSKRTFTALEQQMQRYFINRKIIVFYQPIEETFSIAVQRLMQLTGLSKMRPNILMLGFKNNWYELKEQKQLIQYFQAIHAAFDWNMSFCMIRKKGGFDIIQKSLKLEKSNRNFENKSTLIDKLKKEKNISKQFNDQVFNKYSVSPLDGCQVKLSAFRNSNEELASLPSIKEEDYLDNENPLLNEDFFRIIRSSGTLDIWWLYDDGGLTLLLPYILSRRKQFKHCELRVFLLVSRTNNLDQEKRNMALLLRKFRIQFSDVFVLQENQVKPSENTLQVFNRIVNCYRNQTDNQEIPENLRLTDQLLYLFQQKTERYLRLRELLVNHSSKASLIAMTLSIPRKDACTAPLFMTWLDTLTFNLPPFMLIRGNQTNVLTFYS